MPMKESVSHLWYKQNVGEYHNFLGTYLELLERSLDLFPNLDEITLEFPSSETLIDNYEIFTDPRFTNLFKRFWVHKLKNYTDYCKNS